MPWPPQVIVRTDNMDVAGEVVTDLAGYLGLSDLATTADFPKAMADFKSVLSKVGRGYPLLGARATPPPTPLRKMITVFYSCIQLHLFLLSFVLTWPPPRTSPRPWPALSLLLKVGEVHLSTCLSYCRAWAGPSFLLSSPFSSR